MYIKCDNINDFCTMITTCSLNNINDTRLFISAIDSYPNVAFPNTTKNYKKFTYAFFSPLYTAIYSGNVKNKTYESIYDNLLKCQEQCNHSFHIQLFEKLHFNENNNFLTIENELDVI